MFNTLLKTKSDFVDTSIPFYIENVSNSFVTIWIWFSDANVTRPLIKYSKDKTSWSSFYPEYTDPFFIQLLPNERFYFKTSGRLSYSLTQHTYISPNGQVKLGGNIASLVYGDSFTGNETTIPSNYQFQFQRLFAEPTSDELQHFEGNVPSFDSTSIVDAEDVIIPFTNGVAGLFQQTFKGNGSLVKSPSFSKFASNGDWMFSGTFSGCTSLRLVPGFNATSVGLYTFESMFEGCTSLRVAPALPATTLAEGCYQNLFAGCTSLTTAPALPATTLASNCYAGLFSGCTSLTTAPALPATTLAASCYQNLFAGCTSLTTAPALSATTLAGHCYDGLFSGCTSLTTAPVLPATTLAPYCYQGLFSGCTSLTTAPALPATTLAEGCYYSLFSQCTSLTTAPVLPATTLAANCYHGLFSQCTSLSSAPALPATTLAEGCYAHVFDLCSSVNSITCSFTSWVNGATDYWVRGTASSGTFIINNNTLPKEYGIDKIPENWTVSGGAEPVPPTPPTPTDSSKDTPFYVENDTSSDMSVSVSYGASDWFSGVDNVGTPFTIETSTDKTTWTGQQASLYNYFTVPANGKLYFRSEGGNGWAKSIMSGSVWHDDASGEDVSIESDVTVYRHFNVPSSAKIGGNLASLMIGSSFNNDESISTLPYVDPTSYLDGSWQSGMNCNNVGYSHMFDGFDGEVDLFIPDLTGTYVDCYKDYFFACGATGNLNGTVTDLNNNQGQNDQYFGWLTNSNGTFICKQDYASTWQPNTNMYHGGYPTNWTKEIYGATPDPDADPDSKTSEFYVKNLGNSSSTIYLTPKCYDMNNNYAETTMVPETHYPITLEYSTDKTTWTSVNTTSSATGITIPSNTRMYFRSNSVFWGKYINEYTDQPDQRILTNVFTVSANEANNFKVGGNVASLILGASFNGQTGFRTGSKNMNVDPNGNATSSNNHGAFFTGLFEGFGSKLTNVDLFIPRISWESNNDDYWFQDQYRMFNNCTNMTGSITDLCTPSACTMMFGNVATEGTLYYRSDGSTWNQVAPPTWTKTAYSA